MPVNGTDWVVVLCHQNATRIVRISRKTACNTKMTLALATIDVAMTNLVFAVAVMWLLIEDFRTEMRNLSTK